MSQKMKKGAKMWGVVVVLIIITSIFAALVSADINSESDASSAVNHDMARNSLGNTSSFSVNHTEVYLHRTIASERFGNPILDNEFSGRFEKDPWTSFRENHEFSSHFMHQDPSVLAQTRAPDFATISKQGSVFEEGFNSFEGGFKQSGNRTEKPQMRDRRLDGLRTIHNFNYSRTPENVRAFGEASTISISGNYSEFWQESYDANYTEAYIVSDLDGDNNPDVLVFTEKFEPTTDIYTEKVTAKSGSDGTTLWEESVSAVSGDSCSIEIMGFGAPWYYSDYYPYYYYYPQQIKALLPF